jgi:hypothetical protein
MDSHISNGKTIKQGRLDQRGLVHVGLAAVRETKPETASFQACNMDQKSVALRRLVRKDFTSIDGRPEVQEGEM